jgi:hypothetical protein
MDSVGTIGAQAFVPGTKLPFWNQLEDFLTIRLSFGGRKAKWRNKGVRLRTGNKIPNHIVRNGHGYWQPRFVSSGQGRLAAQ